MKKRNFFEKIIFLLAPPSFIVGFSSFCFGASGTDSDYMLGVGGLGARRLEVMDRIIGEETRNAINSVDLAGLRVADVGAGNGSVSVYLLESIGNEGSLHIFDRSNDQLDAARNRFPNDVRNVVFSELNILDNEGVKNYEGQFDVIHVRCLLMHLNNPQQALRNLSTMLAPNGMLILQEPETSNAYASMYENTFNEMTETLLRIGEVSGDWDIGPKLASLIDQTPDLQVEESWTSQVETGAEDTRALLCLGIQELQPAAVQIGERTNEEVDSWFTIVDQLPQIERPSNFTYTLPLQYHYLVRKKKN